MTRIFTVDRDIPSHMLKSTIVDNRINQPVMRCISQNWSRVGAVELQPGEVFYMVRAKFDKQRFFAMVNRFDVWECSLPDLAQHFTKRVEVYRENLKTRKSQRKVA